MREPPSSLLMEQLERLGSPAATALSHARKGVGRIPEDLPTFDGLYIDALVSRKVITAWQAARLEARQSDSLIVGEYILRQPLGQQRRPQVFEAIHRATGRRVALRLLEATRAELIRMEQALQRLVAAGASQRDPSHSIAFPSEVFRVRDGTAESEASSRESVESGRSGASRLAIVSPLIEGQPLTQLLVRRGRFPATVVQAIGAQLLQALAMLESCGVAEGSLRVEKLRLTSAGRIVLVEPGFGGLLTPVLTLHDPPHASVLDLAAPERFSHQAGPSATSDLYAAGCLLWQLLAGRPPFPMGDLFARVAAHRQRTVPDIRELAPETPRALAEAIHRFTRQSPLERPQTIREAVTLWGRGDARVLRRFGRSFSEVVPHLENSRPTRSWQRGLWTTAVILVGVGILLATTREKWQHRVLLAIGSQPAAVAVDVPIGVGKDGAVDAGATAPAFPFDAEFSSAEDSMKQRPISAELSPLRPLPAPSPTGSLLLTESANYEVGEVSTVGPLVIEAAAGTTPRIVVRDQHLKITADSLILRGVTVLSDESPRDTEPSRLLMTVRARNLTVSDCRFELPVTEDVLPCSAIAWRPPDHKDATGGTANFERVVMSGPGSLLYVATPPRTVKMSQVLKVGGDALVSLSKAGNRGNRGSLRLELHRCTMRETSAWIDCQSEIASRSGTTPLEIDAIDSVWLPAGEGSAIIRWKTGDGLRSDWQAAIRITGEGTVLAGHPAIALFDDLHQPLPTPLDGEQLAIEGIVFGDVTFAGPLSTHVENSRVIDSTAPRFSADLPGIEPSQFGSTTRIISIGN